jgi:hypothetical protein
LVRAEEWAPRLPAFRAEGFTVAVTGRSPDALKITADEIMRLINE